MYSGLVHFLTGALVLLMVIAGASRILTMKETPAMIKAGADAISNLFRGAFDQ